MCREVDASALEPFRIHASDAQLEDLRTRLRNTRWPDRETVDDLSQGVPLAYVQELCEYWAEVYDWRAREARLNAFPQYRTRLGDLGIHFLHLRSPEPDARPLILTHGWPGSIVEFLGVLPRLSDPRAHGESGVPAFHVVCPSLPGYGFSDKPQAPGCGVERIAELWALLMQRLGYARYFAQGGDWGALVTRALAVCDPEHCAGIHLNMSVVPPDPATFSELTPQEQSALEGLRFYQTHDSGYSKQQRTRPQTLGYGLVDSPAGQAAWILEKFFAWTDCDGDPENVVARDVLLDNVMLYWLPATGASSARLYWESMGALATDPVSVPAGMSVFPKEIFRASRRWVEKGFPKLVHWNELPRGGHFAALEQPDLFIDEVRSCFGGMS